jgi:hypothetical protein
VQGQLYALYGCIVIFKRVIRLLIKLYRDFFDVAASTKDGAVVFRLLVFVLLSFVIGMQLGYAFF